MFINQKHSSYVRYFNILTNDDSVLIFQEFLRFLCRLTRSGTMAVRSSGKPCEIKSGCQSIEEMKLVQMILKHISKMASCLEWCLDNTK